MRQVHGFLPVCPCPASLSVSVTAAAGHPVAQAQVEDPPLPAPLQSHCPLLWEVQSVPDRNDSRSSATALAGAWPPFLLFLLPQPHHTAGQGPARGVPQGCSSGAIGASLGVQSTVPLPHPTEPQLPSSLVSTVSSLLLSLLPQGCAHQGSFT